MKKETRIGYWNVQTLYETGKLKQLTLEFQRFNLDILGISECRWTGNGEHITSTGEKLIYSGNEQHHTNGVGILLSREAANAMIEWNPISPRIITARFNSRSRKTTIIQVYAPTEVSDVEKKREFYSMLQSTFASIKKGDIKILMGDLNAQIGSSNANIEHVMGKHGLGNINENGDLLVDFCNTNSLVIGNSIFPHKRHHKVTWRSPNNITENQIDHFCISRIWRKSLLDTRAFRSADVASDHFLCIAKLRMRVMAKPQGNQSDRARFNVCNLKSQTTREAFTHRLQNSICTNPPPTGGINEMWTHIKKSFIDTCSHVLKYQRKKKAEWISDHSLDLIEKRRLVKTNREQARTRALKLDFDSKYRALKNQVKQSCRRDKRLWTEDLAAQAENASRTNNPRTLYQITRKLSGKYFNTARPIRDESSTIVTNEAEQLDCWHKHFSKILNHCETAPSTSEASLSTPPDDLHPHETSINTNPPTLEEIVEAIKELKNGKAAGNDNIPAEALKADPHITARAFLPLFQAIWLEEKLPDEWLQGILIKVPKKGDLSLCKNYRGIMLLSAPSKILSKVLLNRIRARIERTLRRTQAGFRPSRSCTDHIVTLRIILEQINEWQSNLHACFVDFTTAFDSICRDNIWSSLRSRHIPSKLINIIKSHYDGFTCKVLHNKMLSPDIKPKTGVKQGCLMSPILFLVVLDDVMRRALPDNHGISWDMFGQLEELSYADDIVLLSTNRSDMQTKLNLLSEHASNVGLRINTTKTEFLTTAENKPTFSIYNEQIKEAEKFCYLGSVVTPDGGTTEDITSRINKARGTFAQLRNIWASNSISKQTKLKIYNSNVKSVLLYGCESWSLTSALVRKVQVFSNSCLRKILRVWWPQTISNQQLLASTNEIPIELEIKRKKWRWIGHTLRKDVKETCRAVLWWNPQGNRSRGRPKTTWRRNTDTELNQQNTSWNEIKILARNRINYRSFVMALRSTGS